MADWFKFYENGIYESRFQWAVHEESGVCPVFVWILSECCKHKSDNFGWKGTDCELFGVSHVINLTAPRVNSSLNLLVQIGYISMDGASIKVLQWNKFQSDYMRKRFKPMSGHTPDTVRTVSDHLHTEERRVEEIREEKKALNPSISNQSNDFSEFWTLYPKKKAKGDALKAWNKLSPPPELKDSILKAVLAQSKLPDWTKEGGKFIPFPASWLNAARWEDELEVGLFEKKRPSFDEIEALKAKEVSNGQ